MLSFKCIKLIKKIKHIHQLNIKTRKQAETFCCQTETKDKKAWTSNEGSDFTSLKLNNDQNREPTSIGDRQNRLELVRDLCRCVLFLVFGSEERAATLHF
ncbi:hypothetical protein A4A49_12549 [Nicotiana attenuata]|uniref:Uncharacterized protein n=1 Tax=Nicotiana attenuata TaxID=49451 RepID=A0A314L6S0_NICAT|nr:hypothetical protein A4A49_12549 [Nicotiana attenuata]